VFSLGEGSGCTFTVDIPITSRTESNSLPNKNSNTNVTNNNNIVLPHMSAGNDIQTSRSCRSYILVVDDSVSTRKMQNRLLTSYNYTCMEATDGAHALEVFKENMLSENENRFDVILVYYQMPVMDGPTTIKLIRSQGYTGLIIGVTGNVLHEDRILMLNAGANHVMRKPFDINKFEMLLKSKAN
jgi:CheY-like chemotaxis protein